MKTRHLIRAHSVKGETHWKHMSYASASIGPSLLQTFWFESKSDLNGCCKVRTPVATVAHLRAKWHHAVFLTTFLLRVWLQGRSGWGKGQLTKLWSWTASLEGTKNKLWSARSTGIPRLGLLDHRRDVLINKHAKETLAITVSQCHRDYSNLSAAVIHEASNEQHPVGSGLNDWMNLSLHVFHILIGLFIFVNYVK